MNETNGIMVLCVVGVHKLTTVMPVEHKVRVLDGEAQFRSDGCTREGEGRPARRRGGGRGDAEEIKTLSSIEILGFSQIFLSDIPGISEVYTKAGRGSCFSWRLSALPSLLPPHWETALQ